MQGSGYRVKCRSDTCDDAVVIPDHGCDLLIPQSVRCQGLALETSSPSLGPSLAALYRVSTTL